VRCFGSAQTLDLTNKSGGPAPWTVILGANGSGKTTLLRALAALSARRVDTVWASVWNAYVTPVTFERSGTEASTISGVVRFGCILGSRARTRQRRIELRIRHDASGASFNYDSESLLRLAAYGASRKLVAGSMEDVEPQSSIVSLFSNGVSLRDPQRLMLRLHYASLRRAKGKSSRQFERVKSALLRLLPEVDDLRIPLPKGSEPARVEFKSKGAWIGIDGLSLGYQTFAAWTVDFASRLFEWYPRAADPLSQPAVCLVDEIDLHMHPVWQRRVMDHLSEVFPRTQFVATAHSPLVVQAAAGANLAVLRWKNGEVEIENDPHVVEGWRIDQLVTSDLFGLESARSPKVEAAMRDRVRLLQKPSLTSQEKQRLERLNAEVESLPTPESESHASAFDLIERAAAAIERRRKRA